MEAMWSRYLPSLKKTWEMVQMGTIGEVRLLRADFGFRTPVNPADRVFNPALGGGALLDVGIYPLSLAYWILGKPVRIQAQAHLGSSGVDEQTAILLGFGQGQLALLSTAIRTTTPHEATIISTAGWIRIHSPWWASEALTLHVNGKAETIPCPMTGNGYNYEAEEVSNCLRLGLLESETMPLDETVAIMRVMDEIRAKIGLIYPMETQSQPVDLLGNR
jgi:predicted dehydrogenase